VAGGLVGQRRDVHATHRHVNSTSAIRVGNGIRVIRRGDVDGHDDEVGIIVQRQLLHVLVLERDLVIVVQVGRE
jgi:hypothetical protein